MNKYSSQGIVLSRRNYHEADRIIVIYSKGYGKVTTLAKGVRKLKSRKRGSVESFSLIKFSCNKTKGMDILTEVDLIESYSNIRKDIKTASVAYYFMDVIEKITPDQEENPQLFNLLDSYLTLLTQNTNLKKAREKFTREILISLGFWPEEKPLENPYPLLDQVIEKKLSSVRIGKILSKA